MIRNLKALGLMAVAALALSAMFASVAQAQKGTITTGETPNTHITATLHGEQYGTEAENAFTAFGSTVACENKGVTYTGTVLNGTATSITMTPTYKDCKQGARPVTVNMNGCDYIFTQPETIEPKGTGLYTGKADLTCPKGQNIDIEVFNEGTPTAHSGGLNCTIKVFATGAATSEGGVEHTVQELGGHVIYQNTENANGDDITVNATIENLSVTAKGTCSFGLDLTENKGTFKSKVTLTATNDPAEGPHNEPLEVWLSDN